MKRSYFRILGFSLVAAIMFFNVQFMKMDDNSNITLAIVQKSINANAEDGVGTWEEVIYQTYPRQITCKGDGPLECKWP